MDDTSIHLRNTTFNIQACKAQHILPFFSGTFSCHSCTKQIDSTLTAAPMWLWQLYFCAAAALGTTLVMQPEIRMHQDYCRRKGTTRIARESTVENHKPFEQAMQSLRIHRIRRTCARRNHELFPLLLAYSTPASRILLITSTSMRLRGR